LAIPGHALAQKCGSDAMWLSAASSRMVMTPNGPDAPQRWPFHQSTWTLSASPVGLSLASGAPVRSAPGLLHCDATAACLVERFEALLPHGVAGRHS